MWKGIDTYLGLYSYPFIYWPYEVESKKYERQKTPQQTDGPEKHYGAANVRYEELLTRLYRKEN